MMIKEKPNEHELSKSLFSFLFTLIAGFMLSYWDLLLLHLVRQIGGPIFVWSTYIFQVPVQVV